MNELEKALKEIAASTSEMKREEFGTLYDFVEQAAKRLDIKEPIKLRRWSWNMPNAAATWFKPYNKAGQQEAQVLITDGMLKLFGENNFRQNLSDEVKAVLGHELSHLKDGALRTVTMPASKVGLFGLPLAFAAAYYILDKVYRKLEHHKGEQMSLMTAIKEVVVNEKLGFGKPTEGPIDPKDKDAHKAQLYEMMMRSGGMIAAAAAGSVTRLGAVRHFKWHAEFRADRAGALLSGSPEAMTSALEKLMQAMEKGKGERIIIELPIGVSSDINELLKNCWDRIKAYWESEKTLISVEAFHAHPTNKQRFAKLATFKESESFRELVEKARNGQEISGI